MVELQRRSNLHLHGVAKVQYGDSDPVKLAGVSRLHENGRREVFAFLSGIARSRARVSAGATVTSSSGVAIAPSSGTTIASRFEIARRCPEVALALRFFAASANWFNLYKVAEIIEQDVGSVKGLVDKGWCTKGDLDHFTASANNYHATGLDARLDWRPMKKPAMTLQEAQDFIRVLLDSWIRTK